ncbi:MAG TPA: undecaprenyl-phosphate glucose phosphotransferase [Flavisolibacter sp.]|nr:undecaprenyl-phosphate glucose phosphotransferase [Flavisolibacter sp.]
MNNRFLHLLQLSLAFLDFLVINCVFFTAQYLFRQQTLIEQNAEYVYFIFSLNIFWLVVVLLKNIYHQRYIISFEQFTKVSLQAMVYFLLLVTVYLFFFRMLLLSRMFVVVVLASISLSIFLNRFIYLAIYHYFRKREWLMSRIVIIGYNNLSKRLVDYLSADGINKEIVGFCEEYENVHELSNYPILSDVSGAVEICKKHGANEIYSTIAPEHNHQLYQLIQSADQNCIRFRIVPDLGFFFNRQMHIDYLKEIPVISVRKEPLEDLGNRIKKRIFDIVVSSFAILFILSWLIPIVGLLIWLESRGPLFFVQPRTGKNNKTFLCLKFRSMRLNAFAHSQQATRNDGRVTRIGRFLRRTSLDEFPQFINVLKGDMSIVGPRPHMLKHTDEYSNLIGQYMVRQLLKPGITGWAQVNGLRGETRTLSQMQKRVDHDLWYLENWSLLLDIRIMIMTVYNTIKGKHDVF